MKRLYCGMLAIVLLLGLSIAAFPAYAANAEEHLKEAAAYDQKVTELDAVIQEHEQMKKDFPNRFANFDGKFGRGGTMDSHCDAIIEKTKALQVEYRDFAEAHRAEAVKV